MILTILLKNIVSSRRCLEPEFEREIAEFEKQTAIANDKSSIIEPIDI